MSKKNLARTAIEGGRTGGSKYQRRVSHQYHRANERSFLRKVLVDKDRDVCERLPAPNLRTAQGRYGYEISFADKLNPVYRWLDKQVGRPWDKIYSELRARFDSRTTAGRHILFDHILSSVVQHTDARDYMDYVIDKHGLFQLNKKSYRYRRRNGKAQ